MFPCTLCDVKLNSVEQKKAHCRGKNHIKRVAAREKALELGTDFDRTPDHCEVCNVPLTSKMTAIDHFKGKMHQKKVKAVEDLRQGFRNFCDVCDVRLQSLKVSEAHFNGKQHKKRARKTNSTRTKDKNAPGERSPNGEAVEKVCDNSQSFCFVANQPSNNTSTWESLNCDSDSDSKDPLSEFRSSLSGKSNSSTESGTPHSTSPNDANESNFSFENTLLVQGNTTFSEQIYNYAFNSSSNELSTAQEFEPSTRPEADSATTTTQQTKSGVITDEVFQINDGGRWESKGKHLVPTYLNETCNNTFRDSSFIHDYNIKNGVVARTRDLEQLTQSVFQLLSELDCPISCVDIVQRVGCVSSSEVLSVLDRLEKRKRASKSGFNPTLWSICTGTARQGNNAQTSQPCATGNTWSLENSRETPFFQRTNESHLTTVSNALPPTTQAFPSPTTAILSTSTTTTARREGVIYPSDLPQVFETNLLNLFQQNGVITTREILVKLGWPDEAKLCFVLHNLQQRRVITKEGDAPTRWRLLASTAPRAINDVGVIGEGRKRKSPVQKQFSANERTMSSPPIQNSYPHEEIRDGFRHLNEQEKNVNPKEYKKTNGVWLELEEHGVQNAVRPKPCSVSPRFAYILPEQGNKRHEFSKHPSPTTPFSLIRTETDEFLDDLTETPPSGYQQELYREAMQKHLVCYLPTGTGQCVVMAAVVHHMILLNPTKQVLVVAEDTVRALNTAQRLRKELTGNGTRKKINVGVLSGGLKQFDHKRQVVVTTSSSCLRLLNCGALSWKEVCLLVFDQAGTCANDHPSHQILRDHYFKATTDGRGCRHVPKLLGFLDSSSGEDNWTKSVAKFKCVLRNMGDVHLSCVEHNQEELVETKSEAMFVCVPSSFTKSEQRMFSTLHSYLLLVFDNLASQCQQLNGYRELLQLSFQRYPINDEAFAEFVRLTGKPLDKRLPSCCVKTWRHYHAICEVIFALVECGENFAKVLLGTLKCEAFGFFWANEVGLPVNELSLYLLPPALAKKFTSGSVDANLLGSGIRELVEQLQIIQWENARVSSERPLALVIVKLSKTAKALANYLARYPELAKRNVKTTFVDDSHTSQQKAIVSAIKRRQYQVVVSTADVQRELDLPHCELVILMDQPSSQSALVKLRQKQATNVVTICREADGEEKLKELLKKEDDVEKAIDFIRGMKS